MQKEKEKKKLKTLQQIEPQTTVRRSNGPTKERDFGARFLAEVTYEKIRRCKLTS